MLLYYISPNRLLGKHAEHDLLVGLDHGAIPQHAMIQVPPPLANQGRGGVPSALAFPLHRYFSPLSVLYPFAPSLPHSHLICNLHSCQIFGERKKFPLISFTVMQVKEISGLSRHISGFCIQ